MFYKNTIYTLILVAAFFGALEVTLALFGVRPLLLDEDPLVGFADNVPLFIPITRPDNSVVMGTAPNQLRLFSYQEFPGNKADGSYRIFCMGGSTTHGRPYYDRVSFCGWLRAYLTAADPTRNWEVINAGGISFASYRVARLMNELKQYEPDLFVVYSGQNEFLEERSYRGLINLPTWLINLNATLSGTRTYSAMKNMIDAIRYDLPGPAQHGETLSGNVNEILNHTVGPESYHRDDTLKQKIITHYRLNMIRMVKIARSVDSDIIFVQPAINVKDMSPFKSEHKEGLGEPEREQWEARFARAIDLQRGGDFDAALTVYRQAMDFDERYADLHFRMGQVFFSLGRYAEAESAFRRAVEEDIVPLRILGSMQRIVAQVAASEQVPLIDFPSILRDAYLSKYDHAVFGKEYFRDHVHTNLEGYRLLGLALFDELVIQGVVTPDATWNEAHRERVEQKVIAGLDPRTEGHVSLNLGKVLEWAGKFDEAYSSFQRAFEILGPSPMLYDRLGRDSYILGKYHDTVRYLREAVALYPEEQGLRVSLALVLAKQGRTDKAIESYRTEIEHHPTSHRAHAGLATLLAQQGDEDGASEHYRLALHFKPDFEYALVKLAYLLIKQERYDEALVYASDALQSNPQQHRAHNALGLIMKKQGKSDQARHHFSEATRLKPAYTATFAGTPTDDTLTTSSRTDKH